MTRTNFTSGLPLEEQLGYSRAVRVDTRLYTSPTAPVDDDLVVQGSDGAEQAELILSRLQSIFVKAGFTFADVVSATLYVVDDPRVASAYEVFARYFSDVKPTIAVVNVRPWDNPDLLIEIALLADKGAVPVSAP